MPPAAVVMRLMVEQVSDSSVRVSWESINNPMIINYTVYYLLIGSCKEENNVTIPSSMNSIVIRNLTGSVITDYQFQVAATAEINGEVIMGERSEVRKSEMVPTIFTDPSKIYNNVLILWGLYSSNTGLAFKLSVAVIITFLLTVILYTSIIFVTYCIYHRHDGGTKKE